jgi:hypothetical protein
VQVITADLRTLPMEQWRTLAPVLLD